MKKSSKVVSLLLAVLMAVSCITGLSFASVAAAEDNAINFRVPDEWKDAGEILAVYCEIYHIYGDDSDFTHPAWKNKYAKADYDASTGIATFTDTEIKDRKGVVVHTPMEDGNDYGILFVCTYPTGSGIADQQTGNVLVSTECYGGTIRTTGEFTENTMDSQKFDAVATWEDERLSAYGPALSITSTGKIVGEAVPVNMPKALPIAQFIGTYAKSEINGKYVTPETIQGMMNDRRFQVSAKDVMDAYADFYAADLEAGTETVATLDEVAAIVGYVEEPDTTEAPTTEAPTTEEPTTEAPTTEEPTTEAPTTAETTMFAGPVYGDANLDGNINIDDATFVQKAGIGLVTLTEAQAAVANVNPAEDDVINIIDVTYIQKWLAGGYKNTAYVGLDYKEAADDTYVVAGSEEVFGANFDGTSEANTMTEVDGIYTLTLKDVQPIEHAQFKIVKNGEVWIGNGEFNYDFVVTKACDVTFTYNPETGEVKVEGEGVADYEFSFESLRAVGNGGAGWLNDVAWNPAADANLMTEVSEGVYQLVMTDVEANSNAQIKFAADGSWGINWGGVFAGFDVATDAVYNSNDNITVVIGEGDSDENLYTVTVTLDLTGFDFNSAEKAGAKFTVSQKVQEEEPQTTEPETEPQTTEPETTEPGPEPTPDTYVVAGVKDVFGVDWDPVAPQNLMSDEDKDGVFTFTLTNVQPIEGAEFKIVQNGTTWIGDPELEGPYNNFKFTVETVSDVTFTYNTATTEVKTIITPVGQVDTTAGTEPETTEPETEPQTTEPETTTPAPETIFKSVGLIGVVDGNGGWDSESSELEYADGVWSIVLTFNGGANNFKARVNDAWTISFGCGGDGEDTNYTETLTGTYKISVADGAENGTALTVEPVEDTTEPETTEPETEPQTTEPETEPQTTEPETEPQTTEPETEPQTTEPQPVTVKVSFDASVITKGDERYAVYTFTEDSSAWYDAVAEGNGIYSVEVPADVTVIFCRMDGASTENNWDNRWDQTYNLSIDGTLYTITGKEDSGLFQLLGKWDTEEPETTEPETEPQTTEPETTEPGPEPTPDTYVVAGEPASLFGAAWDPTAVANLMSDEDGDGIYTLTFTNVEPVSGEYQIVKNGTDWIGGGFGVNFKFTVETVSDVTFTYNTATTEVATIITPVEEETTEPETTEPETTTPAPEKVFNSVGIIGVVDGNGGWDSESSELEYADGVWSIVLTFNGGANNFKARVNDAWDISFGAGGDGEETNYTETLTGTYKISVADGAENGTALTVEPVGEEETTEPETTEPETTTPAPEKKFNSVGIIGVVDGNGGWDSESSELEYADGVWSIVLTFNGGANNFKARVNDAWTISFGRGGDGEQTNYTETLTGTYKISVADGAENGTALTVEPVTAD